MGMPRFFLAEQVRKAGFSNRRFSKETGLAEVTVSRILNGHGEPTLLNKLRIAKALSLPMSDLFPSAEKKGGQDNG